MTVNEKAMFIRDVVETPFLHVSNAVIGRGARKIHIQDKHNKRNVYAVITTPGEKTLKDKISKGKYTFRKI